MGMQPQKPIAGRARSAALANAYARHERGELVHIMPGAVRTRVQRAGKFEWEEVPSDGLTVHQAALIKTAEGGSATIKSKSRGEQKIPPGSMLRAKQIVGREPEWWLPKAHKLRWEEIRGAK